MLYMSKVFDDKARRKYGLVSNFLYNMSAAGKWDSCSAMFPTPSCSLRWTASPAPGKTEGRFTVELDHVSFQYPGSDTYVINDLSLKFDIGEKMAIVGRNGSGKTTFIKLLCRLYDVTEGCIKANGVDIRDYDYGAYCGLFAVVFQDFRVFSFPWGRMWRQARRWIRRGPRTHWSGPGWESAWGGCRISWIPMWAGNSRRTA